jgi:vacuolar protein sorting-associated protein 54
MLLAHMIHRRLLQFFPSLFDSNIFIVFFLDSNIKAATTMLSPPSNDNVNNTDAVISPNENNLPRSISQASTIASSSKNQKEEFTVNSFTQNLSSVLSDPTRSKSETIHFFTRHWGEQFIPTTNFPLPTSIPKITVEHFRQYLLTIAKNHRHYLRSKKALRRALALHYDQNEIDIEELPIIFLDPLFALHDPKYFNAVFLEPLPEEDDQMISPSEKRRNEERRSAGKGEDEPTLSRAESCTSLTSTFSLQAQMPPDALSGRSFRSYQHLHNRLEYHHDTVGALLNCQLESKSEEFWKTVNSYTALQSDLEDARQKVTEIRQGLQLSNENIVQKMKRVVEINCERQNKVLLLQRLRDIACLRDAQTTVQMLLNQNDFPKALECIEMAQEVLHSDLKGVNCFRHLSTQLEELHKVIGRMLQDDFVALIQKEFGKPLEKESEIVYQEGQLHPVIHGLLRCGEFKFLQVLKHEIVEAIKNTIRQIIKNRIIEYGGDLTEFDPSLLNWGDQMRKLNFEQWITTLTAVFDSLLLFCRRIISIQELILENVDRVIIFEKNREKYMEKDENNSIENDDNEDNENNIPEGKAAEEDQTSLEGLKLSQSTANFQGITVTENGGNLPRSVSDTNFAISRKESAVSSVTSEDPHGSGGYISSAATMLSLPCRDLQQVRSILPCLLEHATITAQERVGRLLVAKSKDGFLERCSPISFRKVDKCVQKFVNECNELVQNQTSSTGLFPSLQPHAAAGQFRSESPTPLSASSNKSSLLHTMQQQSTRLISRFHESRKQKLANILDSEQWKPANVPHIFQQIADHWCETGKISDLINIEYHHSTTGEEVAVDYSTMPSTDFINLDGEKFYLVGTALILFRMIAQYSDLVEMFPDCSSEILLHLIEICKSFNSRTCQLILGAGALQYVGLKTISVKNLALAARCLQFISKIIQALKDDFKEMLPSEKQHLLRHFDSTFRDYHDHVDEIYSKLSSVIDFHIVSCLSSWKTVGESPTPPFQQLIKQIGKFYNGFSSVMPASETRKILLRVHSNLKSHFRNILNQHDVTPQNALSYGLASADFDYYIENMRALPNCENFPNDTINDVLG